MGESIGKNISKYVSSKCSQKFLDHAKQCTTDAPETTAKKLCNKHHEQLVISLAIEPPLKI